MKLLLVVCIAHLAGLFCTSVAAQDLFANTAQTERSYNYVEGFYLLNLENDLPDNAEVDFPVLLRFSLDLRPQFSLRGEFIDQSYSIVADNGLTGGFDVGIYSLGVRYRDTLEGWKNTDWLVGAVYSRVAVDITIGSQILIGDESDFYGAYVGLRRTITDRLEGELGIDFIKPESGGSFSGTGEVALVYRVGRHLDVALGGTSLTDGDNYGIGFRYTWF